LPRSQRLHAVVGGFEVANALPLFVDGAPAHSIQIVPGEVAGGVGTGCAEQQRAGNDDQK
jgi:hypothetical protein